MLIERTDRTDRLGRILAADRRRLQKRMESGKATERDRRSLRIVEHLDERRLAERGGVEVRRSPAAAPTGRRLAPGRRDTQDVGVDEAPALIGGAIVEGCAAVFYDAADPTGTTYKLYEDLVERIDPKAFDEDLAAGGDRLALWSHDSTNPLARQSGTLQLTTDSKGLRFSFCPANTQAGRDLVSLCRAGVVKGASFTFSAQDIAWLDEGGEYTRLLLRVQTYEVSPCADPAYTGTSCSVRDTLKMGGTPVAGLDVLRGRAGTWSELARMRLRLAEAGC